MHAVIRTHELSPDANDAALATALDQLLNRGAAVRLGDALLLTQAAGVLHCDVVDDEHAIHRCAFEYEVMVENARHAFEASPIARRLPEGPRHWRVVIPKAGQRVPVWPLPTSESES